MADKPEDKKDTATKLVGKLSVSTMGADSTIGKRENKRVPLCRFMGEARGIVEKVDQRGEPIYGLTGSFFGTNIATGENYQSGVCYLPPGIHEMILAALDSELAGDEAGGRAPNKGAAIIFAIDTFSIPASNKAGFTYESVDLAETRRIDPLAELKASLAKIDLPALPAPAKK